MNEYIFPAIICGIWFIVMIGLLASNLRYKE